MSGNELFRFRQQINVQMIYDNFVFTKWTTQHVSSVIAFYVRDLLFSGVVCQRQKEKNERKPSTFQMETSWRDPSHRLMCFGGGGTIREVKRGGGWRIEKMISFTNLIIAMLSSHIYLTWYFEVYLHQFLRVLQAYLRTFKESIIAYL